MAGEAVCSFVSLAVCRPSMSAIALAGDGPCERA